MRAALPYFALFVMFVGAHAVADYFQRRVSAAQVSACKQKEKGAELITDSAGQKLCVKIIERIKE